jgi:hypothetical protein
MSRRNSPNAIADLGELSLLTDFVVDKRQGQRASAKKHRRNRHYEKQFIRNTLAHPPQSGGAEPDEPGISLLREAPPQPREGP